MKSAEIVTPALLALDSEGKVIRHLHRIGALSSDFIDRWLRQVLKDQGQKSSAKTAEEALRDGDLKRAKVLLGAARGPGARVLRGRLRLRQGKLREARKTLAAIDKPDAALLRGHIAMREGNWSRAAVEFKKSQQTAGPHFDEASYWLGACLQRRGQLDAAMTQWRQATSRSPFGLKSALASLAGGPRPWLAETLRTWPEKGNLPTQTETTAPMAFDGPESVRRLMEFQKQDGSFTGQDGVVGYWDPALTAIAVDALDRWLKKLSSKDRQAAKQATDMALEWFEAWAQKPSTRLDPFNAPYALSTLLRHQRTQAAKRVTARILEGQGEDGNWTVYGPKRPASFSTAQCLLALSKAKSAKIKVPAKDFRRAWLALRSMRTPGSLFPYSTANGHGWMTNDHGAIGRDSLCEDALFAAGKGDKKSLEAALRRFIEHHRELRMPTKKLYDYFNTRGHGGYFFFYSHRNALEASRHASPKTRRELVAAVQKSVLAAREGDGTFMDHYLIGRAYATAMALYILAEPLSR